jgi:hypothetical protein
MPESKFNASIVGIGGKEVTMRRRDELTERLRDKVVVVMRIS